MYPGTYPDVQSSAPSALQSQMAVVLRSDSACTLENHSLPVRIGADFGGVFMALPDLHNCFSESGPETMQC